MCGIRCCVLNRDAVSEDALVPEWLKRRGPDEQNSQSFSLSREENGCGNDGGCYCLLQTSVLCLRQTRTSQPVKITWKERVGSSTLERLAYFCWNGEIYEIFEGNDDEGGAHTDKSDDSLWLRSDTEWMAKKIEDILSSPNALRSQDSATDKDNYLVQALQQLVGRLHAEFAFCLVIPDHGIYYGKDTFGRRSLVLFDNSSSENVEEDAVVWEVASVVNRNIQMDRSGGPLWTEVPPSTVFHYHPGTLQTTAYPWSPIASLPKPYSLPLEASVSDYQQILYKLLYNAVECRLRFQGGDPSNLHSRFAVLFSGGLDSTVLAYLVLNVCKQCDVQLINVSFVKDLNNSNSNKNDGETAADTKAAYESLEDLKRIFPERDISFIHRKVSWDEIQTVQEERIPHLLQPKDAAIMDLNIATALWFAADTTRNGNRILFSGLGADEYLGGYGRHRKAFEQGGADRLRQEMSLDQDRLWERNFGRDDRVLCDNGQEVRYPFLDHHVTGFLRNDCPLEHVCDFSLPPGQGDKRLLRLLARDLGLDAASTAVKRAIQFGSRISHVVDKQRFGSRRQANRRTGQPKEGVRG